MFENTKKSLLEKINKSGVYLLHFKDKISDKHTTQHYLGYADDIDARAAQHKSGKGARLTQVAKEKNIDFDIAKTWPGKDRNFERKMKNRKNAPKLCPICQKEKGLFHETRHVCEEFHSYAKPHFFKSKQQPFEIYKNPTKHEFHSIGKPAARIIAHDGNVYAWGADHDFHGNVASKLKIPTFDGDATLIKHKNNDVSLLVHDKDAPHWKPNSKVMRHLQSIVHPNKLKISAGGIL